VDDNTNAITQKYGNLIVPRSVRLVQGKFMPYEFDLTNIPDQPQISQEFLLELSTLLCHHGLDQILGLIVLDKHDSALTVEVTEGKMNIMVERGNVSEDELIQALWIFGKDEDEACHCRESCMRRDTHIENHSCS
jgi:hypothetical protein